MTTPLPQDTDGRASAEAEGVLLAQAKGNDVLAVGPGLGNTPGVAHLVAALLKNTRCALVLDADALNVLAGKTESLRGRSIPPVLTPHPGEFARLIGSTIAAVQGNRRELAARFAGDHGIVLVLKGHESVITDGQRTVINSTGNPGMATGGSGDVLAGLIAALLGQKLAPFEAAQLGAHIHGLAGDLAYSHLGGQSLIATDLIAYFPDAFRSLTKETPR
jgi:NAD(P)H-hydrate epimerase